VVVVLSTTFYGGSGIECCILRWCALGCGAFKLMGARVSLHEWQRDRSLDQGEGICEHRVAC